jgi:hypothetical protein
MIKVKAQKQKIILVVQPKLCINSWYMESSGGATLAFFKFVQGQCKNKNMNLLI